MISLSLKILLIFICVILTLQLYILLGINDFKLQKKQLFALIPLLLILLTLYRLDIPTPVADVSTKDVQEETIKSDPIVVAEEEIISQEVEQDVEPVIQPRTKEIKEVKPILETIQSKEEIDFKTINPLMVIGMGFLLPSMAHYVLN